VRSDGQALLNQVATVRTPLRREMRRNANDSRASFLRFALEHLDELSPTRVVNALREVTIFDHAANIQAFHDDDSVLVDVFASSLVQKVLTLAGYLQVRPGYASSGSLLTRRPLIAAAQLALFAAQLFLGAPVMMCVSNGVAFRIGKEDPQAHVQTYRRTVFSGRRVYQELADYQDVPLAVGTQHEVSCLRCAFERPVLLYLYALAKLARNPKPAVFKPSVPTLSVLPEAYRMPAVSALETREPNLLAEFSTREVSPYGLIQPAGEGLDRGRWDVFSTPSLETGCERVLEQKGAGLPVMFSNRLKHLVVQASGFHQARHKLLSLPAGRVKPVLESLKHHADYTAVGAAIHRQLYRNSSLPGFL
jgi:hypothetical protein